uniref:HNH endonuclease n=1 Tax=Shinella sp. TaxID=1870904 RepID=UPI003F71FFF0
MARTVAEWIGKTDDHRAPKKVRDRIIERDNRCHLCGQPIQTAQRWDLDHVQALINGGENRESNLRCRF